MALGYVRLPVIGTALTRRKARLSSGPWNKPQCPERVRGFMPRKPLDRRRAERDEKERLQVHLKALFS